MGGEREMEIAWGEIKGGFRGFEKLALEFVKKQFKNPSWKKTSETRDGNKDAVAYVFGYCSNKEQQAQWWMEAKYSTEQTLVTRYRLDATIVSAILNGNVKKVIFITNIGIRAKTIIDIRKALTKSTSCRDVLFCTRPILESWLCKNPSIYKDFFPPLALGETLKQSEALYLTQEIDFYHQSADSVIFAEPCKMLSCNNRYVGHFSVYSEEDRIVTLKKNRHCRGVSLKGKRTFTLHAGENPIKFEVVLSSKLPDESSFYFLLDNIEVFPSSSIHLSSQCSIHCELPGQKEIVVNVQKLQKLFLRNTYCEYCAISAVSGSGKTEMLEQLASNPVLNDEHLFYRSFSFSDVENSLLIVDFILFLLFPYLSPDEIDVNYLNQLGNTNIIDQVYKLIQMRNDYNALVDYLIQKCTPDNFLPHKMNVNARIVYLDNLHYLSDPLFLFFRKLMVEIQNRKIPVYMVVTIDTNTLNQERWIDLTLHCNIKLYQFQLSIDDIFAVMGGSLQVRETAKNLLQTGNLTIVELFAFAQYISSESRVIETTEQLLAALRLFQYSDILGKETRGKFIKVFNQYPKCHILCNTIFSSYTPVKIPEEFSPELNALLEKDLVRYDLYNRLIPRNESIREYYRSYFGISLQQNIVFSSNEDRLRTTLENEASPEVLGQAAKDIIMLANDKQYNAVTYIGKTQFEQESSRNALENRMRNRTLFLQMYFSYSYAAHMQSNVENPRLHFKQIISRCKESIDKQLLLLCLRAQWELANSDFENFRYDNVLEDIRAGNETLKKMHEYGFFTKAINTQLKYHDFMAIKSFTESELTGEFAAKICYQRALDSKKQGYIDRYFNTKIRLALTRIVVNVQNSLDELEEGTQYFEKNYNGEHKMYLFGEFSRLYYDVVLENHPSLIEPLTKIHEKMKTQQHNNYRKRNFAMATYYYWMGDIEAGNHYLFSEIFMIRNLAQRTMGFYHETMALYQLRKCDTKQAIQSLRQAQEIFSAVESYAQIPEHNIAVLDMIPIEKIMVQFWKGGPLLSDIYYLDLRITW